ncbi:acyl-CoA dehydrogenase family protein [Paraburkholderia phymatum]|uniref:acyl-CoA dehydrogenase n=1 Tax=Paraburkholderia phymatum TaxID=148447 RepID=UPI003175930C
MNLTLNSDRQILRDAAEKLFRSESTPTRIRAAEASGFDAALWRRLVDSGMHLLRTPESAQGLGLGLLDAVLVAEQAGRYLASVPFAEVIAANSLLGHLAGEAAADALQRALDGALFTLLPHEVSPDTAHLVHAASAAGVLALDGEDVVLVEALAGQPEPNLGSAALRRIVLKGQNAQGHRAVLASGPDARMRFLAAVEELKLLQAAMLVGLSRRALEMAAEYSCERQQFGRPIGGFQGIAHPLADSLTNVEGAQLLIWRAVWAIATERPEAGANLAMARWWACQTATSAVTRALRTFGGYGVSLEYDIQLYYRRGKAWGLLAGAPNCELEIIAGRLWDGRSASLPSAGTVDLEFGVGAKAEAFAEQVREFFRQNITDEIKAIRHHSVAGYHAGFAAKLAQAGLLFPHWPPEYGGLGRDAFDNAAMAEVYEEFGMQRITGPVTNQVAQIVMRLGQPECKAEALPRFVVGDALGCLGFSEPSTGSDVFAARTRAIRDGDDWVINGQKMFTTAGNLAHYCFLLARTDADVPKHKGLTVFLVPMDLKGIEVQAVHTIQDERTNITYFTDVRVPDKYRIGEVNGGLAVMTAALELEHSGGDQYRISYDKMFHRAVAYARKAFVDGLPLIERPEVRTCLARVSVHTTIAKLLCYRGIWAVTNQIPGRASFGPMSKLFSTEMYQKDACDLMDVFAPFSVLRDDEDLADIELGYRQSVGMTIYGGTSEIHRSLIAEQGLGMPRSRT